MHILYVDLQYDYGNKDRGMNSIGQKGFKQVFERLGHKVSTFYYDDYLQNLGSLQTDLIGTAKKENPDLIYFALFGNQFEIKTLEILKQIAITVNWFGDDQWRFESFTKKYAPYFTWCITTDPFALKEYKDIGVKNVFLSQWAAIDEKVEYIESPIYEYDVSFIGASQSYRRWFVDHLRKKGIKVAAFGFNWPEGSLNHENMIKLFGKSKINLNLSNSTSFDLRYLIHSIKNPIVVWKSPKTSSQIKARNFEISYYGGFQLTEYVPALEKYFIIGQELACYRDVDEAELQIRHYLENDLDREKIRRAGFMEAHRKHSYTNRHEEFFAYLSTPKRG